VTTPNQPAPDYGLQWENLSYEIGGGIYNYGQEITTDIAALLIHGPRATLENVWELMEENLLKMPLEVLRFFQPFIPGTLIGTDFPDIAKSVETIMAWIPTMPKLLSIDEWLKWLEDVFGPFYESTIKFIEDALNWLEEIFGPFYDEIVKFVEDALKWLAEVFEPLVELVDEILVIAEAAAKLAQEIIDALMQGFNAFGAGVTGFVAADLKQLATAIGAGLGELNHVAMRVTKLEGEIVNALENFATYGQNALSLGADKWNQIYSGAGGGTLGTQLGYAVFQTTADTVNKVALAINKEVLEADFQKVSAVISKPLTDAAESANTLLARVDPLGLNPDNVYAKLTDTKVEIGFVKNGAVTVLGTVNNLLKNGSTYSLEAGVGAAENTFRVVEGSKEILKVTDAAAGTALGSSIGAAFRSAGFGTIAPSQKARPGIVAAFSAISRR
jgi:hypothetical protein